jgi:hypothetical protein
METNKTQAPAPGVTEDPGMAYQAIAQSTAIAIQDAVENLRNINTVALTMIGAASAQSISDPSSVDQMQKVIDMARTITEDAITNLSRVGAVTNEVLQHFASESRTGKKNDDL